MQTSPQNLPARAKGDAPPTFTIIGADGKAAVLPVPTTARALNELYDRRRELNAQLSTVSERRRVVANELATTPEQAAHSGLEARLRLLDQRILNIETEIDATSRQITAAAPAIAEESRFQRQASGSDFGEGFAAGGATLFGVMAALMLFLRWRRKRSAKARPTQQSADSPRLARVEQAVDAIAVEVERISEGQRFVTKLLSEAAPGAALLRKPAVVAESTEPK